MDTPPTANKI